MDLYSTWPSLLAVLCCMALVWPQRLWRFLDETTPSSGKRYVTVDGLRGFLALSVVLHHALISRQFLEIGKWDLPPSAFYSILGQAGVALFFMITAFLFWGRLLDQGSRIDWFGLYCNRFFRIAPLYWVVVALMLLIVGIKTDFQLAVKAGDLTSQIAKWLLPGVLQELPAINGYADTRTVTAGVTWTLYYEWMFYFSLPFLAMAAVRRSWSGFLPACFWLIMVMPAVLSDKFYRDLVAMFAFGMIAASLVRRKPGFVGDSALKSVVALLLLAYPLVARSTVFEWKSIVPLGLFFILVSSGASLFGLLKSRSAIRLGTISYGIYLLQGIVITVIHAPGALGDYAQQGPGQFWWSAVAIMLTLACVAAASYHFVERPCIRFGKRLAASHSGKDAPTAGTLSGQATR
ncbi:acyltransferase family protein [Cupriavidus pauculus]|uniref:Acyltransferase 3 domain-containing protein n=1 Tax=Cupriavidus pauculus TaxID=82633 RepID=A0A2N5CH42_9BURK|nr:acyltransferase [Cupriavidus pauculus]PLQ01521.1 hypothetical protein CYJ10_07535 [Cupriavidus pauculus]